jgi:PAP2 superfamily
LTSAITEIVNAGLKWSHQLPRPGWEKRGVLILKDAFEPDFSTPSSHAQVSTSVATMLCCQFPEPAVLTILPLFAFCVVLSRVYLGVHYIHDVVYGSICGVSVAFIMHFSGAFEWHHALKDSWAQFLTVTLIAIGFYVFLFLVRLIIPDKPEELKEEWTQNAKENTRLSGAAQIQIKRGTLTTYTVPIWSFIGGGLGYCTNLATIGVEAYDPDPNGTRFALGFLGLLPLGALLFFFLMKGDSLPVPRIVVEFCRAATTFVLGFWAQLVIYIYEEHVKSADSRTLWIAFGLSYGFEFLVVVAILIYFFFFKKKSGDSKQESEGQV